MSTLFISLRFCPQEHGSDCPPWHGLELRRPRLKGTNWPTNWWMSFWAFWARLLGGKTRGFWQVFFGPKPIGSNQKRGSDLGKKGMECLEFWSLKLMSFEIPQLISCCFSAPGVPKRKSEFSWSLARQLSRICRKRVLTSRRGVFLFDEQFHPDRPLIDLWFGNDKWTSCNTKVEVPAIFSTLRMPLLWLEKLQNKR